MGLFMGLSELLVLWLGSRDVIAGRMTRRRAGRVQQLSGDAGVADDRVRLGDQSCAARPRVVGPDARGDRDAAGDR